MVADDAEVLDEVEVVETEVSSQEEEEMIEVAEEDKNSFCSITKTHSYIENTLCFVDSVFFI